jgi:hypothetical protein
MNDFKYPGGAVPYTPDTPMLRIKRLACCAVNHMPRLYDGSWCFGYNYVCSRCSMYVGPWSHKRMDRAATALGHNPDQMDVAAACGGGPSRRREE